MTDATQALDNVPQAPTDAPPNAEASAAALLSGESSAEPQAVELPRVVEFRNVSKTYALGTPREYTAIRDINFHIDDLPGVGEFIALLGP